MSILLPLYTYPWPGVWDPLYSAASKYPKLKFRVILNPCSGPCMMGIPEQSYIDEIPKLRDYPNIKTLGYVATNYTDKQIDSVLAEIHQYSLWPSLMNNTRISVDGIFFDEVPGLYHWQKHDYLKSAADAVRTNENLGEKLVVHNPGTLPDAVWNYLDIANTTVIFEDTFANFIDATKFNALKQFHTATNLTTSAFSIMIHSMGNIPDELISWTVTQMKQMVGWNFATNIATPGDYWHSLPTIFNAFIEKYAETDSSGNSGKEADR